MIELYDFLLITDKLWYNESYKTIGVKMKTFTTLKAAKATNLWVLKISNREYLTFPSFTELNAYRKAHNIPFFS